MLPALQVTCECKQCRHYAESVLVYLSSTGKTYSDLSPIWADRPFCSGSCGTHGECDECGHCDLPECECECEKCGECENLIAWCECCVCGSPNYCDECDRCGGPGCQCGCGSYSDGVARFGSTIKVAPWVERGVDVDRLRIHDSDTVRSMWGIDSTIDVCQSAADFYLLKALSEAGGGIYSESEVRADSILSYYRSEARSLLSGLTDRLDSTFRGYVDMIVGGELRHHRAASKSTLKNTGRSEAWGEWHAIREAAGVSALSDAEAMFVDFQSSSYGGDAWARIARTLRERLQGKRTAAQFVDNVFSLEHNGGCLFDKSPWGIHNPMKWHYGQLGQYILPAHGATNPWPILLLVASPEIRELFREVWLQANRSRIALGGRPHRLPVSPRPRKGYYGEKYIDSGDIAPDMMKSGTWS